MSKCAKESVPVYNVTAISVSLGLALIPVVLLVSTVVNKWWFN